MRNAFPLPQTQHPPSNPSNLSRPDLYVYFIPARLVLSMFIESRGFPLIEMLALIIEMSLAMSENVRGRHITCNMPDEFQKDFQLIGCCY